MNEAALKKFSQRLKSNETQVNKTNKAMECETTALKAQVASMERELSDLRAQVSTMVLSSDMENYALKADSTTLPTKGGGIFTGELDTLPERAGSAYLIKTHSNVSINSMNTTMYEMDIGLKLNPGFAALIIPSMELLSYGITICSITPGERIVVVFMSNRSRNNTISKGMVIGRLLLVQA
jgi:hypothetical protein